MRPEFCTIIPSRMGSNRVPMKGLRLLGGKTLIEHSLNAIKDSGRLSERIVINSDGDAWADLSLKLQVEFYRRKKELATSQSMIDDYLYDFMVQEPSDHLAVITPTAPFVRAADLDAAVEQYLASGKDTLISAERIQTHCFMKGGPVNLSRDNQLPRSQDLDPVWALNFSIAIYDCGKFIERYERLGHAVLSGDLTFFELDGFATIDIDEESDFIMAELALSFAERRSKYQASYSPLVKGLLDQGIDTRT